MRCAPPGSGTQIETCELSEWVAASYELPGSVACRLLRAYTNDVYTVTSGGERFVLKVYGRDWRTESEVRYELDLVRHLAAGGLPVAAPVVRGDGDTLGNIKTENGRRCAVLFNYAPGKKPAPPFTPRLYRAFGRAVARMHALSDGFVTEHPRQPLDLRSLIEEPLDLALPLFERPEDREFVIGLAGAVREEIAAFAGAGLDWGPVHGDATLDNLHVTKVRKRPCVDGEIVLYDFDSGGPGWRAMDLQGWAAGDVVPAETRCASAPVWDAFRRGYADIRPLSGTDLWAAPCLTIATDIWGIRIDLENRILRRGRERTRDYLSEQADRLRARARTLLRGDKGRMYSP